jgi:hypothetical protein
MMRDWLRIVGMLLVLLAMLLVTSCAAAPPPLPARQLPPASAWPFCVEYCASQDALFLGVLIADPDGKRYGCACATKPVPAPQAWRGGPT